MLWDYEKTRQQHARKGYGDVMSYSHSLKGPTSAWGTKASSFNSREETKGWTPVCGINSLGDKGI